MKMRMFLHPIFIEVLLVGIIIGCADYNKVYRDLITPGQLQHWTSQDIQSKRAASPFLKAHMQDGRLYVLRNWQRDTTTAYIIGEGSLLNAQRDTLQSSRFRIKIDSVALFETNTLKMSTPVKCLTLITEVSAALSIYCLTHPKACFGSCPTFYLEGDSLRPAAEGFSASIAPSLEATDIDALFLARGDGRQLAIEMRNEALETHVVRYVNLLAVPKAVNHRVYADLQGRFWESDSKVPLLSAFAPEGSCTELLQQADYRERYSLADSNYLGAKELIELEFEVNTPGRYGLIVGCRQTLLSTYLLYQTFAYMGNNVGNWLAALERGHIKSNGSSLIKLLGGIEVLLRDDRGQWRRVGSINEYGPLATDYHLVPVGFLLAGPVKFRLRMTKGNWRLDYVSLVKLKRLVKPLRVKPA